MRAREVWSKLPNVNIIPENLEGFWRFVTERQAIWHRRFVEKLSPPWTKDPILRDYKFTNVYRELDYGTIWYMKNVRKAAKLSLSTKLGSGHIKLPKLQRKMNLLWMTVLYRLVNRVETFEEVGLLPYFQWDSGWRKWKEKFEKRQRRGDQIFTNAHLTLPTHKVGQSKLEKYMEVLSDFRIHLLDLVLEIDNANTLEEVFNTLKTIECVGPFISYEICCDLMLANAIRFTENDWVNPGPGCKRGINLIWPRVHTVEEYQKKIEWLTFNQQHLFKKYHLTFYEYGHPLTLRGIEHSLCEFQKYYKMQHRVGKQRMYFTPREYKQKVLSFGGSIRVN
jgi:5-hmdU DNA kinase-like protein